jgi:sarcosine oxidase subunit gamma
VPDPDRTVWQRRGAWDGILAGGRFGRVEGEPGVVVTPLENLGIATVIGRHERSGDLIAHFAGRYGIAPPAKPAVVRGKDCSLIWAGPEQWLAVSDDRKLPGELAGALGSAAAVSDQSDARAVLRLSGRHVRDVLAKGCPIDLDRRVFGRGATAVTVISHIGVQLWCLPDDDALHVALFRGMAGSFWAWFSTSAAVFGVAVGSGLAAPRRG